MLKEQILQIQEQASDLRVIVIGDIMIDRYYHGVVSRISPEAPVPVLDWRKTVDRPGGASNVALNLKKLNCQVEMISVIGKDWLFNLFTLGLMFPINVAILPVYFVLRQMNEIGIVTHFYQEEDRATTLKSRFLADHHQLLRLDQEDTHPISSEAESFILNSFSQAIKKGISTVILQDYNKGIFQEDLIHQIISLANLNQIPVCVDPKKDHFFDYKNVSLFKPNLKEAKAALQIPSHKKVNIQVIFDELLLKLNCKNLMITLASEGLIIGNELESKIVPTKERLVKDVSGAGDTVISVAAICTALNVSHAVMADLCNLAGGIVCESPGVSTITWEAIVKDLK